MSDIFIPKNTADILELLKNKNAQICAGGTNVFVDRKKGKNTGDLILLRDIKDLSYIKKDNAFWHIGPLTTFYDIEGFKTGDKCLLALKKAASLVGGPQIRNAGTIGGNIVSASPSADSVPVLMALDASVTLLSHCGSREEKLKDFMLGVNKVDIRPDELLYDISIPLQSGKCAFYKVGKRNALSIAVVNQAVYMEEENGIITKIRIAIGSCAPKCVRAEKTEQLISAMSVKDVLCPGFKKELSKKMSLDISPISDIRADADYRMSVAVNVLLENLRVLEG